MIRRLHTFVLSLVMLAVPMGAGIASAQSSAPMVNVLCTREVVSEYGPIHAYSVNVTIVNTYAESIRGSIFLIQEDGTLDRRILSRSIDSGESQTIDARTGNNVEPQGWQVRLYYDNGPFFDIEEYENYIFFSQNYTGGECSGVNSAPPTVAPQTPTPVPPTAVPTTAPTATLAPDQTPTPVPNSFTLVSAERMCADQAFAASWTGSNLSALEFSLTNTSDEWTTGWVNADPAAGTFNLAVDHHNYDKVAAHATFADGTDTTAYLDIGDCTEAPAPPPPPPAVVDPPANPPAAAPVVSSLPSTGVGKHQTSILAACGIVFIVVTAFLVGSSRKRA